MPPFFNPPTAPSAAELYRIAKGWLPRVLFAKPGVREAIMQGAVQFARVGLRVDELYEQTMIARSTGAYLRQHLKDRGSAPQSDESEAAAQLRARTIALAATPEALLSIAQALIDQAGVVGTVVLVELRLEKAWCNVDLLGQRVAFAGRGDRCGPDRPPSFTIVILPFGTPDGVRDAVNAAVAAKRSSGYPHLIEVRRIAP